MLIYQRWNGIDYLKGLMIIFVVIGHVVSGSVDENIIRYLIYSFHMPVFLSISGFLINKTNFEDLQLVDLYKKYFKRIIVPWCFAFVFYFILINASKILSQSIHLKDLLVSILYPYYHLWYIPSLLLMIMFLWLYVKLNISTSIVLIFSILFTFVWLILNPNGQNTSNMFFVLLGDKRTYYYFVYFLFGFTLRNFIF